MINFTPLSSKYVIRTAREPIELLVKSIIVMSKHIDLVKKLMGASPQLSLAKVIQIEELPGDASN
ncbi:MAG: hypothetical protein KDD53_07175, partial [Bdellovibrionales bacterium]|nr:hypothetical protein [Bdellovibrionales bacterium]